MKSYIKPSANPSFITDPTANGSTKKLSKELRAWTNTHQSQAFTWTFFTTRIPIPFARTSYLFTVFMGRFTIPGSKDFGVIEKKFRISLSIISTKYKNPKRLRCSPNAFARATDSDFLVLKVVTLNTISCSKISQTCWTILMTHWRTQNPSWETKKNPIHPVGREIGYPKTVLEFESLPLITPLIPFYGGQFGWTKGKGTFFKYVINLELSLVQNTSTVIWIQVFTFPKKSRNGRPTYPVGSRKQSNSLGWAFQRRSIRQTDASRW